MSRKKAVIKHKPLLIDNLLKSNDIEIRLFSGITCQDCIPNNSNYFIECDFAGYQRNLLDPNYWTHDVSVMEKYLATSYYSPILYDNFSESTVSIKGYYAVKQSTEELLFYSEFLDIMSLDSYESFSLELFFSIDKYFYKNPKLLNLTIYINNPESSYINNALLEIKNTAYNGVSCDECIKDILGFNSNFYNNAYFLSINQNIMNSGGPVPSNLTFTVLIIAPGYNDYTQSVTLTLNQDSYTINANMVQQ